MSFWTYVTAIADVVIADEYESITNEEIIDKIFGKCLNYEDMTEDKWEDEPDVYMPMGSEGTLKATVLYRNYYDMRIAIGGSLRDYTKPEVVIDWFKKKCSKVTISGLACIKVYSDIYGTYKLML